VVQSRGRSSNHIGLDCTAKALAMASLCFCPPERWLGKAFHFSVIPTFCWRMGEVKEFAFCRTDGSGFPVVCQ
jgi:hypothetical protein